MKFLTSKNKLLFSLIFVLAIIFNCSKDDNASEAVTPIISVQGTAISILPVINTSFPFLNFEDTVKDQVSLVKQITINGDNLESDITVVAPNGFEVSLDSTTFLTSVTVGLADANADKIIYVRFAPTVVLNYNEVLTFQNLELSSSVEIPVTGNGLPIVHNYTTFSSERLAFGGGFSQSSTQTFNLHNDLTNVETIKMYVQLRCPTGGCDEWDVYANVKVKDPSSGEMYEIGRYITPYWNDNSQLDRGFEFDVTDFKSLLSGSAELRIRTECWNAKGYEVTVDFDYIEGTPDYPFYAVSRVLAYDDWSSSGVPYGVNSAFDLTRSITIPANAEQTHLRSIISGWGHATGSPGTNCAEWCYKSHNIKIDGTNMFTHSLDALGCASNPVSNQSPGNWQQNRAGWCPGMVVPVRKDDFTSNMAGSTFNFEYDYEDWVNDMGNGAAFYATSTFVIVKSSTPIAKPVVVD